MFVIYKQLPNSGEMVLAGEYESDVLALADAQLLFDTEGSLVCVERNDGGSTALVAEFGTPAVVDPVVAAQPVVPAGALPYADFLRMFTLEERVAIRTEAQTNMVVNDYMELAKAQGYVKMTSTEAQQGIMYLAYLGKITEARAAEILGV